MHVKELLAKVHAKGKPDVAMATSGQHALQLPEQRQGQASRAEHLCVGKLLKF